MGTSHTQFVPDAPGDPATPARDGLTTFAAVVGLFIAGLGLGAFAGQLDHPFSAIAMVLPLVALTAFLYRPRAAGTVAIGSMAAWAVSREMLGTEPVWSILFSFTMSLLILFGTGWLVESLLTARARARHFAETEPLTGLLNRNTFLSRLQTEIDRSRRRQHPLAVAFLDCDHFKNWNDEHGHLAGDDVLRLIATTLRATTRSYDSVARMGGDEFAVLFPDLEPAEAKAAGERLHADVCGALRERGLPITISAGLVAFARPPVDARDVIATADALMYSAKDLGRDRVTALIDPQTSDGSPGPLPHASASFELSTS